MTVLFVLVALGVVLAIGLLAVGRLGDLPPVEPDRAPDRLPAGPLAGPDVDAVRFDVSLRGYRMDEVDDVLDRVAADLAARDAVIAELRARLGDEPAEATAVLAGAAPASDGRAPDEAAGAGATGDEGPDQPRQE